MGKVNLYIKSCLISEKNEYNIKGILQDEIIKYQDKDGALKTPVMLHRVIFGSMERFHGILIEHYAGAFPTWLAPQQVALVPVSSDKHNENET